MQKKSIELRIKIHMNSKHGTANNYSCHWILSAHVTIDVKRRFHSARRVARRGAARRGERRIAAGSALCNRSFIRLDDMRDTRQSH